MKQLLLILTSRKVAITFFLGISSGLPLALVMSTLGGWLRRNEVDIKTIGFFSVVTMPYAFKFFWAPLLDRYQLPFLGRRTGWIALCQLFLVAGILLMSTCHPPENLQLLAYYAAIVAFFSASQDIVVDAYRTELFRKEETGPGAAVGVTGSRIGLIVGGPLAFVLADHLSWNEVYQSMAALMAICLVATLLAPQAEAIAAPRTLADSFMKPFADYFTKQNAILLLFVVLLYKLGDAVAGTLTTPFLIDMKYTNTEIGLWNKFVGNGFTILGTLTGGFCMVRLGLFRSLLIFAVLQGLSNFVFILVANHPGTTWALIAAIATENLCGGLGTAAFVALLMSMCSREYAATQYALLSSIMALTRMMAGIPTGIAVEALGWQGFFVASAALALPGIFMLLYAKNAVLRIYK